MIPISCNIDWLQLNCRALGNNVMLLNKRHKLVKLPYSTSMFECVQELFNGDERIATITSSPRLKSMDKGVIMVKLENNKLYQRNVYEYVKELLSDLCLRFNNFTRIDICLDFNKLANNRCPEKMIKALIADKILSCCAGKVAFNGTRSHGIIMEYMRLGSRGSGLVSYIYNKSKELEEKENKPWIIESWIKNNIDIDKDVWRLEFSISDFNYVFIDRDTAELMEIDKLGFLLIARSNKIIHSLINKYFRFVINDGKSRKDRMKKVNMFGEMKESLHIEKINKSESANKSTKILIKQLHKLNNELREKNKHYYNPAYNLLNHILEKHELHKWYINKEYQW